MAIGKLEVKAFNKTRQKLFRFGLIFGLLLAMLTNASGQFSDGSSTSQGKDTSNKADQNLKSIARVNSSTLAMEFSLPLMTYPGRNGNSLPVGFSYSSKVWRMESRLTWWYRRIVTGIPKYVTDVNAVYGERTAAGWSSNLQPPRIEEKIQIYDENGQPWEPNILDEPRLNSAWQSVLNDFLDQGNNLAVPCGTYCASWVYRCPGGPGTSCQASEATIACGSYATEWCEIGGGGGPILPEPPPPVQLYYVKRVHVVMPDGSSQEFRAGDAPIHCGNSNTGCPTDMNGTYLSVTGSGMRLVRNGNQNTLYLRDGGRYRFINNSSNAEYIDADGNKLTFSSTTDATTGVTTNKWIDTMGREIVDPMQQNLTTQRQASGTKDVVLPGFESGQQKYKMKWLPLKPSACKESTDPNCGGGEANGALEDYTQKLYYETKYFCRGNLAEDLNALSNGEVLFPQSESGIRPCNGFNVQTDASDNVIVGPDGNPIVYATRFNPTVLAEVELPNQKKYQFKYNRYGEITKIIYPTGSYETFEYAQIPPTDGVGSSTYSQTNRGVIERRVYDSNGTLEQRWRYSAGIVNGTYKVTTIAPKGDDPLGDGIKTESYLTAFGTVDSNYGFNSPTAGFPLEERLYDELGNIRSRTLTDYVIKNSANAGRDARVKRTISVVIDNGQALAKLSENFYDDAGSTDPEYFSHLNLKRTKGYHYAVIPLSLARNDGQQAPLANLQSIAGYFNNSLLASIAETDFMYGEPGSVGYAYKQRGIHGLEVETRVLNPSNTAEIISRTQTFYDEYTFASSGTLAGNLTATWVDPATDATLPANTGNLRGNPTTEKLWDDDNDNWIETHTQYDQYGNVRKVWEPNENVSNSNRFTETQYSGDYGFAYPTRVITPSPDPTGTHGTNEISTTETKYDFITGLVKETTNDFGQVMKTEYNDPLLRTTRVYPLNFAAPETHTIYNDTEFWVKVRKQIDGTNWDEATTFSDVLGRTVKTQTKDSQGDVFTDIEYDFLGRVKQKSNPYRMGDIKLWSKVRYDEMGRAVESFAPVEDGQTGDSLGITAHGISTAPGYIGTFVLSTDAANKQKRAIMNALGQLMVIDEPDHTGAISALPQSTPNPSPTPSPSPGGGGGPTGNCLIPENCPVNLVETEYPNYSTFYRYNAQGKMVEVIQGQQRRYFKYDSLGRLIRVRQPEQEPNDSLDMSDSYNTSGKWTAAFSYDLMGNVKRSTDANGTNIVNEYDKANRIIRKCYTKQNINLAASILSCSQLSSGQIDTDTPAVDYFYDGKGLEGSVAPRVGTVNPIFAKGKLTKVTSSHSETRYTQFDEAGRLLQMEQRTPVTGEMIANVVPQVSSYQYNLSGAMIQETYPSQRVVKNEFESDGDLARIYGKASHQTATERTYANGFSHTPDGKIQRLKLGNGRWQSARFNNRIQLTELALGTSDGDGSLWKLKYEYGELQSNGTVSASKNTGNIAKQVVSFNGLSNPLVQTYKYDSLYRLKEAQETNGSNQTWKESFSYDRYGNRTGREKFVGTTQIVNDHKNQPLIDPLTNRFSTGQNYHYDKNGNLLQDAEGRVFVFNGDNKQRLVTANGQNVGEYFYDGEGKRVKKKVYNSNGVVTEETVFVYSAGKLVAEYSTQTPSQNPSTKWTTTDHLGSPRVITDSFGKVVSRKDFLPFGEEAINNTGERPTTHQYGTPDGVRQKFSGYQKDDETELDFADARMYERRHGRFTAVDPLLASGKSANPQSFNRYVYCLNNPLKYIDPDGKIPVETVIDVVSLASSFYDLVRNPSLMTAAFFVWDAAATLIPYMPGSYVAKATRALRNGGAKISKEAAEWSAQIGSQGFRGLKAQGIIKRGLQNNLERFVNNDYIKRGYALLSQGDDSTRALLGQADSVRAADFVGVTRSGTFMVGETKGYREIATGVEQLTNTLQGLYNKVRNQGSGFQAGAEIIIEGTAETFNNINREYGVNGSTLVKFVDGKAEVVSIKVFDGRRRVANIPVQVRFVQ